MFTSTCGSSTRSGHRTSLSRVGACWGASRKRFAKGAPRYELEEVLGVRYKGKLGTRVTYLTAQDEGMKKLIWPQNEIIFQGSMIQAEALPGAEVLATVTLPWVAPELAH